MSAPRTVAGLPGLLPHCDVCEGTGVIEMSEGPTICRFCRPRGTFAAMVEAFDRAKDRVSRGR